MTNTPPRIPVAAAPSEFFNPPPPPPMPADLDAALDDRLSPAEQRRVLGMVYRAAMAYVHGGTVEEWAKTAHDLAHTVYLRGIPAYREAVEAPASRRFSDSAPRTVEDVLADLDGASHA
ncbi:hypothetical protein AB0395_21595 [Streptosporangium sp. NPDC051023]|uniref:hypothetical protein n=1 Tax=Streptosporangium sp. NPDC051023 TaxID=3155410 RepID=UPI00344B2585